LSPGEGVYQGCCKKHGGLFHLFGLTLNLGGAGKGCILW
jgi:hypothetical protein